MVNENCLAGMKCPDCGYEDKFRIRGTAVFEVADDGTQDYWDIEWDDDSYCCCDYCGKEGELRDFKTASEEA